MKHKSVPSELTIDFLVPANLASRYRARLTGLSRLDGQLRLAFCPSIFRSGISSCRADVSLVSGSLFLKVRGVVEVHVSANGAVGQVHFGQPLERRDFDALCHACQLEAVFPDSGDGPDQASEASVEKLPDESRADPAASSAASLH